MIRSTRLPPGHQAFAWLCVCLPERLIADAPVHAPASSGNETSSPLKKNEILLGKNTRGGVRDKYQGSIMTQQQHAHQPAPRK